MCQRRCRAGSNEGDADRLADGARRAEPGALSARVSGRTRRPRLCRRTQSELGDSYKRLAYYVDRVLKGAKPADLPIEQPTTFEMVINLKTAAVLGLTILQAVLLRADILIR